MVVTTLFVSTDRKKRLSSFSSTLLHADRASKFRLSCGCWGSLRHGGGHMALCMASVDGGRRWEEGVLRAEHVRLMAAPPAVLSEQQ